MTRTIEFETERLNVRPWASQLADPRRRDALGVELQIVLSPAVFRHLPEPVKLKVGHQTIEDWIAARDAESTVLIIRSRGKSELLGLLLLAEFSEQDEPVDVHLGYLFAEPAWGNGYATELLSGLVDHYKGLGQPVRLLGGVGHNNAASARALQKAGFTKDEELSDDLTDLFRLQING